MKKLFLLYYRSYQGLSTPAWMLAAVMLINRTGAMVLPFMAIYLHESLHFSLLHTGTVLSLFGLGSLLGNITGGWLTDRLGNFRVQCASLFFAVPLYIILAYLQSFVAVSIGVLVLSFVTEVFRPANAVAITLYAKPENTTRAFSLNRMAINLGFSFGPSLGGLLASWSYQLLFWGNAVGSLLAGILFYVYFSNFKKLSSTRAPKRPASKPPRLRTAYQDGPYLFFAFLCMLYFIPFCQLFNAIPLFLDNKAGWSKSAIGLLMGYSGFLIVLTEMLLVSFAERRFSIYQTILWGCFFCIPAYAFFVWSDQFWVVYLSISLISLSEILVLPFMATVGARRAYSDNKGSYMALNSLGFSVAFIITPYLSTTIIENLGYNMLWLCNTLLILMTMGGLYFLKKRMPLRPAALPAKNDPETVSS